MRAAKKFDPRRGTRFSTYAVPWIQQGILRALKRAPMVRIPDYLYRTGARPRPAFPLFDENGRPTVEVLDRPHPGAPPEGLREALDAARSLT